jgi:VWFA-related protein
MHPAVRYGVSSAVAAAFWTFCSVVSPAQATPVSPAQAPTEEPTLVQRPIPTLSITTREVLLDVVVTDASKHPVTGLKASDFVVTEEGQGQGITHLEEHHPLSAADLGRIQMPALPPNTFTNYNPVPNSNAYTVILLDAMDTPIAAQMYVREQLVSFLKHVQPGTPIAIFQLDSEMRLIQGFSSDPKVLLAAAESKRDMPSLQKPSYASRSINQMVRNQVLGQGMQAMGKYLAAFPGRKNLIWFTARLPYWYASDNSDSAIEYREGHTFHDDFSVLEDGVVGLTDALTLSRVAVYPIDSRGLQTLPQFDASNRGNPGLPSNAHFYTAQAFQHMDLDAIADATGGRAYYNTNGLDHILAEIVDDGSNYYTVAYSTTNTVWNGQFRRIKITVDRPGVKLQYRPGYYAVDRTQQEQRQLAAMQKRMANAAHQQYKPENDAGTQQQSNGVIAKPKGGFDAAMELGAIPPTEIIFTANVEKDDKVLKLNKKTPLPKDNYLLPEFKDKPFHNCTVKIATDAHSLHVTKTADGIRHGAVQFVTAVYTPDGRMINSLETTASFDMRDATYRKMLDNGFPVMQEIAVPAKGNYFLRIGVHDLGDDRVGALEIAVDEVRPDVAAQGSPGH